ncbi:MAG: type II CAAX endopeptidase family protein [Xenococcaceae cyanobacterium MO_188.B19]|nr:type II CAAX endopeptidase family protein [Xenococcaceae cyanobacterium MO_188.B19]
MIIRRLILAFLTLVAVVNIFDSLNRSFSAPQIQSRLELYQSNLVLRVSDIQIEDNDPSFQQLIEGVIGENPYNTTTKQYQKARKEAELARDNFQNKIESLTVVSNNNSNVEVISEKNTSQQSLETEQLTQQVSEVERFIDEIDLKTGILLATDDKTEESLNIWQQLLNRIDDDEDEYYQTGLVLSKLWQNQPEITGNVQSIIEDNLDGWFRDRALTRVYKIQNDSSSLSSLKNQQQEAANQALVKLAFIAAIPAIGGFSGVILVIFLLVQLLLKGENSILATNNDKYWETPWDWEITWQVLIVGFFFVGQFVLPLILGIVGLNPSDSSLTIKALYVLFTYILMSVGGIIVLYLSIKSFFPLPESWFKFKLKSNWFVWGIGGYLVAIPAVLIISLINQQIWHGQGGSNPLLYLALQAQDKLALSIFFITASIAAPVFEEIMFRGFLLPSLTRYLPVSTSIIISGFLFAIAHLSLSEILPLATLGIILGIVYTRSRNLLASMLLHSLWNSGTLISLFVLGSGS